MKIKKCMYPDGTTYPKIELDDESNDTLVFRINSYMDLWFLAQIKNALDNMRIECDLVIPCLLDAQADRRFDWNQSHNLKLVCKFINDMKWRNVSIFHPHNAEVVEEAIDHIHIQTNWDYIVKVLSRIQFNDLEHGAVELSKSSLKDNLILMSTDAGGFKPLMKLCDTILWEGEIEPAEKSRAWVDGKSILTQYIQRQDFEGKDVLIIDDLCIYGGTFIGLVKLLRERNAGRIFLAVSHITVERPSPEIWKAFDMVFTTNSKGLTYHWYEPESVNLRFPDNLEVINMFRPEDYIVKE